MTQPITPSYAGHRFPPEVIGHAVRLYFRFPLSLRMVEEMLAARGIAVSHEMVRQVGPRVRPWLRERDPPAPAPARRRMAPGRGCRPNFHYVDGRDLEWHFQEKNSLCFPALLPTP